MKSYTNTTETCTERFTNTKMHVHSSRHGNKARQSIRIPTRWHKSTRVSPYTNAASYSQKRTHIPAKAYWHIYIQVLKHIYTHACTYIHTQSNIINTTIRDAIFRFPSTQGAKKAWDRKEAQRRSGRRPKLVKNRCQEHGYKDMQESNKAGRVNFVSLVYLTSAGKVQQKAIQGRKKHSRFRNHDIDMHISNLLWIGIVRVRSTRKCKVSGQQLLGPPWSKIMIHSFM